VNQQIVRWDGSKQIDSPRSSQNLGLTSRPRPKVQSVPTFSAAEKVSEQCQNELLGTFVSRQGGLSISGSLLPPLSGRVADCPERVPYVTHCTLPISDARHKPAQSASVAKWPRWVPVDDPSRPAAKVSEAHPPSDASGQRRRVRSVRTVWHRSGSRRGNVGSAHRIGTVAIGR
jgi:hypothetical protein